MASRTLGVHGKDRPPLKSLSAQVTSLNVAGLLVLAERGVEKIKEVSSTAAFKTFFGEYLPTFYGRYVVDGFFANLRGVPGKLKIRRFVAADAVAAEEVLKDGGGAIPSLITLVNEIKLDYNSHLDEVGIHPVDDIANVVTSPDAMDKASVIVLLAEMKGVINAHIFSDVGLLLPVYHNTAGTPIELLADALITVSELIALANQIKVAYTAHIADAVAHDAADAVNVIASPDAAVAVGVSTIRMRAGFMGDEDKGVHGNNLAYTVSHTYKFESALSVDATAADVLVNVSSAVGFAVGDHIVIRDEVNSLSEGAVIVDKDVSARTITIAAPGLINPYAEADDISVRTLNFDLMLWRKDNKGLTKEVEKWINLSMGVGTVDYFLTKINDINAGSGHILVEDVVSAETNVLEMLPYEVTVPVFFDDIVGTDGTLPSNQDFIDLFTEFDDVRDIRFLACPENVSDAVNRAGEIYCQGSTRGDCVWFSNLMPHQNFAQLRQIGSNLLGGETSYMLNVAQWLEVSDPIGLGANPKKEVPNLGHILGHVIYRVAVYGYQRVPAGQQVALSGVSAIVGDQIMNDEERTVLADAGVNVINFADNIGFVLKNARMASADSANMWFNQRFMRIVYKKTFEEAVKNLENDETGDGLLRKIYTIFFSFLSSDFRGNSRTGNKPAFLITTRADGSQSLFEDVVQIIVDQTNNSQEDVLAGRVNATLYFTPPPPAESIEIDVGISLMLGSGE